MLHKLAFAAITFLAMGAVGCVTDYAIVAPEKEVIVEVEKEVIVEVEKEVEVPLGDVWIDSFNQPNSLNGVDIVWVIDRSGSMHDDEPRIIAGIEAMLNNLPPSGWRLNIISADPNKALDYYGPQFFPIVPGDTIDDVIDLFDEVKLINGGYEEGFSAIYEYMTDTNSYAHTWMRHDAALLVVFVSDEDDQSTSDFPSPIPDFTNWYSLQRTAGSVFLASIVHLLPADSSCNGSAMHTGDRYMDATNYYLGSIVDICDSDWSAGVVDATVTIEPYEEYPLTYTPFPSTVRVFIDTALAPATDWHYDSATNSVVFDVIPSGGSLVEIGYVIQPA